MPFLTLPPDGYRLYYEEQGQGPPIILLHSATGSTRDWRRAAPLLAAGGYRVLAYDRRGFGRSDPLPEPDWPLDYLHASRDELFAFLDALGLERVILVGNSDGATIALLAAAAQPERVQAVAAESPHMWYEKSTLLPAFDRFQKTLGADPRFWRAMRWAHGDRAEEVVRRWRRRWTNPAFFAWSDRDALARTRCPVLVMHGEEDAYFPIAHSQEIVRLLPDARLVVYEGVGHVLHLEIVNAYAQDVFEFLSGIQEKYI